MAVTLFDFQQKCVDKLGAPTIVSRLIGDEMGLGKTYEGIAIDQQLRFDTDNMNAKTLIVAPLAVHESWIRHLLAMGVPARAIATIDQKDRMPFTTVLEYNQFQYYILHYEALRLIPELKKVPWFHIMCDEVHRIKNRKAQSTQALKALKPRFKTGMSGTPADNKPQDLWSILNWLYPKKYGSFWRFIKYYCVEELTQGKGTTFRKVVDVNKETIPELLQDMQPWYVRRLKTQVLDLPEKYHTERWVELSPGQRRAYNEMRKHMIAWIGENEEVPLVAPVVIAQLVRLQQFALGSVNYWTDGKIHIEEPSTKLESLVQIVEDNEDEGIVVFSQSRSMVELVERRMQRLKVPTGLYTGMVPRAQRDYNVAAFQGGDTRVFAATIAAGGEGITLTRSSTAVFLDRHWNPTKNIQAEDRLHRIGQHWPVEIIDIMAANTVDLGRKASIAAKWETLKYLLGDTVDPAIYEKINDPSLQGEAVRDALQIFRS